MTADPDRPEVLLSISSEVEAAAIVTALAQYGIQAISVGGYVSGFKAEAPGNVAVVVKLAEFDRAKRALAETRQEQAEIDWSNVDVMETAELPAAADRPAGPASARHAVASRVWWTVEFVGIAMCIVVWLFTRELTPPLVYAFAALAVIGIFMALLSASCRGHSDCQRRMSQQ
jgi:hypothetical protein